MPGDDTFFSWMCREYEVRCKLLDLHEYKRVTKVDEKNRHEVTAEQSNGYMPQSSSSLRNQQDRPHEFYVKKLGVEDR